MLFTGTYYLRVRISSGRYSKAVLEEHQGTLSLEDYSWVLPDGNKIESYIYLWGSIILPTVPSSQNPTVWKNLKIVIENRIENLQEQLEGISEDTKQGTKRKRWVVLKRDLDVLTKTYNTLFIPVSVQFIKGL